ncbi:MAG: thiamine phosphate synthase [Candidatus Hydrogenedentota bacterium]|nr:MAG: thiamine phosphate synthase [Candidatus Hydrogenedentota bacterium]
MPRVEFDLYLITDRRQCERGDLESCVEQALRGGIRAVQLREKDLSTRERFEVGEKLRELASRFGAKLLVNGDAALARAIGADGVHLPQDGLRADVCRTFLEPEMLIGVSTHSVSEAKEAERTGADFVTYGPVYHTLSKAKYGPPVGLDSLREVCATVGLPVFALGGIRAANVGDVLSAGAAGVALISAVLAGPEVEVAASEVVRRLRQARSARILSKKEG